jgi:hypothetical protein
MRTAVKVIAFLAFTLVPQHAFAQEETGASTQQKKPTKHRLRRPGERAASSSTDAETATDVRSRAANRRALGARLEGADTDAQGATVAPPNRRLNTRIGGRLDTRVSRRIEGGAKPNSDQTFSSGQH